MNAQAKPRRRRSVAALISTIALLAAACSQAASQAPTSQPTAASQAPGSGAAGPKHVSIVNKDMTDDEINAAVAKEGSLVVGNWTYAATDELVKQFQAYVKTTYGADIKLTYAGTQSPSEYLTKLAGSPAPYDVIAIEENYWYDASEQGLVQDYLPSGLIPNQSLVLESFQHVPTSIAFQSTAYPGIVYNKTKAPFLKSLKDLADPRLKNKVTLPAAGDITAGGFFLGLAAELGKDYKDPNQMKDVVDWAVTNIGPVGIALGSDGNVWKQVN